MPEEISFGVLLKRFRESIIFPKKLSQAEAANSIGISTRLYGDWEREKMFPRQEYLPRIASVLRLDYSDEQRLYHAAALVSIKTCDLPFPKNALFTGREAYLEQIGQLLTPECPVAISGMGGIGKTQLALEYAYRSYRNGVYRAVFWIDSASKETIEVGYLDIAQLLGIPESHRQDIRATIKNVKHWLKERTRWLLIMDNADDLGLARSYFPIEHQGHILLTTRTHIVDNVAKRIDIETFEPEEGLTFILQRSYTLEKDDTDIRKSAVELVGLLGNYPLALNQAGAYIHETVTSFSEYLELYREYRNLLLHWQGSLEGKHSEHPEPVAVTIMISVQKAAKYSRVATDILCFCAFLQPDDIPKELLEWDDGFIADPIAIGEGIAALRRYSLIQFNKQKNMLSLHRLVQDVVTDNMTVGDERQWKGRVIKALSGALMEAWRSEWVEYWHVLNHHVDPCLSWKDEELVFTEEASLLFFAQGCTRTIGSMTAVEFLNRALTLSDSTLGYEHPLSVQIAHRLAFNYSYMRMYDHVAPLYERIMPVYKSWGGYENQNLQSCVLNLALAYALQGEYERAIALWQPLVTYKQSALEINDLQLSSTLYYFDRICKASDGSLEHMRQRWNPFLMRYLPPYARDEPTPFYFGKPTPRTRVKTLETMKKRHEKDRAAMDRLFSFMAEHRDWSPSAIAENFIL